MLVCTGGCCGYCPCCRRYRGDDNDGLMLLVLLGVGFLIVCLSGCVPSQPGSQPKPFASDDLDACLAIVVDQSGSFADSWDDRAYNLFLELADRFFTEGAGGESRIVIAQLSGNANAVLFEGRPDELRARFGSPAELNAFLRNKADPSGSAVYQATRQSIDYVSSLSGVGEETRLLTVVLSDMVDNSAGRVEAGKQMLASLKRYQQLGGGLALYFVAEDQKARWRRILGMAGFEPGTYVIESTLVARPTLPRFD